MGDLVSVIIPTYNRPELLLGRAIPSVLAQTHTDIDLHVVGDGCEPEVAAQIEAGITDPRVRFTNRPRHVYPEDPGAAWRVRGSAAINYGIDTALGSVLSLLADDDAYLPTFIEVLLDALIQEDVGAVYCRSEVVGHGFLGAWPPRFAGQSGGELLWYKNDLRFNPDCWKDGTPNDWDFWSRMMAVVKFGYVPQVLYRYFPSEHIPGCYPA